jgi:signal transduction histidine kinase/DNA-binding response OmpR family regulator
MELDHLHTEKLEEVDRLKSRFFANISHEFRTPITLILGPVEDMLSGEFKGNMKEQFKMIIRSGNRLLLLVNQLLDLSKLESGKLKLRVQATGIIDLINGLVQAFESLAVRKNIILNFNSEMDSQEVYLDVDKFEKIINNLLSNAFKFTREYGNIEISVCTGEASPDKNLSNPKMIDRNASPQQFPDSDFVEIQITNTGPGIPADRMDKIFDRFYQIGDSYTKDDEGTGIGLALTKELVELHHGTIEVTSIPGKHPPQSPLDRGEVYHTTFSISLPLGKDHLTESEIVEESSIVKTDADLPQPTSSIEDRVSSIPHPESISERREPSTESRVPRILIVEDNADLRNYICESMKNDYQLLEAENGEQGFEKAIEVMPDLIISDVMMPRMDGFELCSKIKTDERTSHIPVILMTARATQEDKIEGLETGADDYITKPFDKKELNVRVSNLTKQRRLLRKRFSQGDILNPSDISVTSTDQKFLNRAMELINRHITDPEFSTEHFASDIGMSRSQLHRKLKALTDHSASEFIRIIRLQRAATLLIRNETTVSEIAFEVGFNNLSYFTRSFRKQFGKTPTDYANKQN